MKGDTLPRNALLESPTSVSLIKKLITIQRIGDEERRASADLSWNDEEEKEEINNENRQELGLLLERAQDNAGRAVSFLGFLSTE